MQRTQNTPLLLLLVVCIMTVASVMIAAVFVSAGKSTVVILPATPAQAAPVSAAPADVSAAAALPAGSTAISAATPAAKPSEVTVMRVTAVPALTDVFDKAWDRIPAAEIPLQPQQTTSPILEAASITSISVQAVRDDRRIAWRLSWPTSRPATLAETGRFPDAVAMQMPMADGAPFTMGAKGLPVRILHWKAVWQRDIDAGFQDIEKLYPNAQSDLYLFSPNFGSISAQKLASDPNARQFMPLTAAGNPMANFERKQPVEELVAEGFGSSTTVANSSCTAKGEWKSGQWTVVIDRPLDPNDPLVARLQSTAANLISLAIWDGSAGNRGGQKHYCTWVPLRIEP